MPYTSNSSALFLYPVSPVWSTTEQQLIDALRSAGFIENKIPSLENSYYVGQSFLHDIAFLGCSPAIQFSATDDNDTFSYVRLIFEQQTTMIQTNKLARLPHCPLCNKTYKTWQQSDITTAWSCPHCGVSSAAHNYKWKRTAGFARVFIAITEIYPKEAIPQSPFLEKLHSLTGVEWDYFYYCA